MFKAITLTLELLLIWIQTRVFGSYIRILLTTNCVIPERLSLCRNMWRQILASCFNSNNENEYSIDK